MATNDSTVAENTACGICSGSVSIPKICPECKRVCCKKCVEDFVAGQRSDVALRCSKCQAAYNVPEIEADDLPEDTIGENFTEKHQQSKGNKEVEAKYCDPCKYQGTCKKASYQCESCDGLHLCNSCYSVHRGGTKTSQHAIVEICQSHFKVLKKYCLDCHTFACVLCVHFEHSDGEHNLKEYEEVLASAEEEQKRATMEAKNVLVGLREQKAFIDRVNDVMEKKREVWFRSIGKKASAKLRGYDQLIALLKQERDELEKEASGDKQTVLRNCKVVKDAKKAIAELENAFSDTVKNGETMHSDKREAYIALQKKFFQPAKKLKKKAEETSHMVQCEKMVNELQAILGQYVHRDTELIFATHGDTSPVEKVQDLDTTLKQNLGEIIPPVALDKIKADLAKYNEDEIPDIDDVNDLWSFLQESVDVLHWVKYSTVQCPEMWELI